MRRLYSLAMLLAQPAVRRKLAWRARAEPLYAQAVPERFGHYDTVWPAGSGTTVWVHAVSLGETRTAALLIEQLRLALPGMRLVLSHGTATGRAEGQRLLQPGDVQVWQPWDSEPAVRRFLDHFQPRIGLLMETEVWPNWVAACQKRGLPLVLANARLSEQSLNKALRLAWLARPAYRGLAAVWAQTPEHASRLRRLGAWVPGVFGNLKFDARPDAGLLAAGRQGRAARRGPVAMLASSRMGEEAQLLGALKEQILGARAAQEARPGAAPSSQTQWLIVPRHPQRFDQVAALIQAQGFALHRRSQGGPWPPAEPPTDAPAPGGSLGSIWLGDTLGEMALYYGLADLALLGGSFEPLGGQNLIEAAACGCPLLMGPHTFNFAEAAGLAVAAGAAQSVASMDEALAAAEDLLAQPERRSEMAAAADRFASAHSGAAQRTAAAVAALIGQQRVDLL
ncbi:MAG: 3-deoxy-D-manno-octulosonic acid transferase [Rhodoferax sp.]|nr:3-deoxy-D-manno-octulosonic acid transferase [Rhodoferax sp.]